MCAFRTLTFLLLIIIYIPCSGQQNYALQFDGTDDFVAVEDYVNMSPASGVTIEAWIKGDIGDNTNTKFIYDRINTSHGFGLTITSDGLSRLTINGGNADVQGITDVLDGTWHHVAGTYDQSSGLLLVYVDGSLEGATSYNAFISYSQEPRNGIGGNAPFPFTCFDGEIGEIRVWDYARDQQQIAGNMCTTLDPNVEAGLIGYWTLNEGEGLLISDETANDNHGELMNGVSWVEASYCPPSDLGSESAWSSIELFPNPASDQVWIELPDRSHQVDVLNILDLTGHIVFEQNVHDRTRIKVPIAGLSAGVYLLVLMEDGNRRYIEKLTVL